MKNLIKGAIAGLVVGFITGCYTPSNVFAKYDYGIRAVAVTTKLIYGVCPNENGVLTLRDAYLGSVSNVVEKSYILKNFSDTFDDACRKSNITNSIVTSDK